MRSMQERAFGNAQRGMRYLDGHHPGWERKMRPDLDVRYGNHCVVKFLTGKTYNVGVFTLGLHNPLEDPIRLGFFVRGDQRHPGTVQEYAHLTVHFRAGADDRLRATQMEIIPPATTVVGEEEVFAGSAR